MLVELVCVNDIWKLGSGIYESQQNLLKSLYVTINDEKL